MSAAQIIEDELPKPTAADLLFRLKTFAEDWERPEDGVYGEVPLPALDQTS
ncbi:MAG: hypothetical protein P4N60_11335 [Verrucomicrobiae bacterium]|nr:hypothetical protein [Verrucomicrobiae bacterium]